MTNTTLLIIAIMIVVILIQMVINIGLSDTKIKLNNMLDDLNTELNEQNETIVMLSKDINNLHIYLDDARQHRDFVIKQKTQLQSSINTLPQDMRSYIERTIKDD